jgi:hypothetical protein
MAQMDQKVKLMFRHSPAQPNSATYEREYPLFSGSTAAGFCIWHQDLDTVFSQTPITTPVSKFNVVTSMLWGDPHDTWHYYHQQKSTKRGRL